MSKYILPAIGAVALIATGAHAQEQRRASVPGGGSAEFGKCSVDVIVDGAAEVEIRGADATLRNLSGQAPQWRRFDCTGAMPGNPTAFRFQGMSGRGNQTLAQDPRGGGVAVIRIEDRQAGPDRYSFDIVWGSAPAGRWGGGGVQFGSDRAMRMCRDEIRQQAEQRLGAGNIVFQSIRVDDMMGGRVVGTISTPQFGSRIRTYSFTCAMNYGTGRVTWARIESPTFGTAGRYDFSQEAIGKCRNEVEGRLRQRGLRNIGFGRIDANQTMSNRVTGTVRGDRGYMPEVYDFSCRVDWDDGDLESIDVMRR